jgi:regulator of sigma E protease
MLIKRRWGETEYGIAAIPLGGYVKISGMNPEEELPPEVVPRAYYNQPVWKRIVVIGAGPAVNLLIAFVIAWGLFLNLGQVVDSSHVYSIVPGSAAASYLHPGDEIVSVDGVGGGAAALRTEIAKHKCTGKPVNGCVAAAPATVVVLRNGHRLTFHIRPRYSSTAGRPLIGFVFGSQVGVGATKAASESVSALWDVTTATLSAIAKIFEPSERTQLHTVVGVYVATQQSFATSATDGLDLIATLSLALAVINLFPFLPLDGGHIFWALAEKVRGKRISIEVMERAGFVGVALILMLFVIGLSNDISALTSGKGLGIH